METILETTLDRGEEPVRQIATSERLEKEGLRLLCLSRIPRCALCPRLEALRIAHETRAKLALPVPAVPESCRHQICAPLIACLRQ